MTTIKRLKVSFIDKDTMKVVNDDDDHILTINKDGELFAKVMIFEDGKLTGFKEVEIRVEEGGSVINI